MNLEVEATITLNIALPTRDSFIPILHMVLTASYKTYHMSGLCWNLHICHTWSSYGHLGNAKWFQECEQSETCSAWPFLREPLMAPNSFFISVTLTFWPHNSLLGWLPHDSEIFVKKKKLQGKILFHLLQWNWYHHILYRHSLKVTFFSE